MDRVAGLLLVAGESRAAGGRTVTAGSHVGRSAIEAAVGVLREAGCAPVVVMLADGAGQAPTEAAGAEVPAEVAGAEAAAGATVVVSDRPGRDGMVAAGLAWLADTPVEAVVLLADGSRASLAAVRRVAALPYPQALVCATYGGRRGHPMLLGRAHWPGIRDALGAGSALLDDYLRECADEVVDLACDALVEPPAAVVGPVVGVAQVFPAQGGAAPSVPAPPAPAPQASVPSAVAPLASAPPALHAPASAPPAPHAPASAPPLSAGTAAAGPSNAGQSSAGQSNAGQSSVGPPATDAGALHGSPAGPDSRPGTPARNLNRAPEGRLPTAVPVTGRPATGGVFPVAGIGLLAAGGFIASTGHGGLQCRSRL